MDLLLEYMSGWDLLRLTPKAEDFVQDIRKLPAEWSVRVSTFLNNLLDTRVPFDVQVHAIEAFVPAPLRKDLLEAYARGALFLHPVQLLGLAKFAISEGLSTNPEVLDTEQQRAFFGALMRYGDLESAELGNVVTEDDAASLALRALAFGHSDVEGLLLSRAYAMWIDLPALGDIASSKYAMNLGEEFAHATRGCTIAEYLTTAFAFRAHVAECGKRELFDALRNWAIAPDVWFQNSRRKSELLRCVSTLAYTRAEFMETFKKLPPKPQFAGATLLPFRDRPLFRLASGQVLVLSTDLLMEGLSTLAYWRVADHLKADHGEQERAKFTQFHALILERYVVNLLRSAHDGDKKRVFAEADANPAEGAADAAIFLDDRVLFVEVTRTQLRYLDTVMTGDLRAFDADVKRTAVKAKQVRNASAAFREGRVRYEGHDTDPDRALPCEHLVVLAEPLPRFPILNDRVRKALTTAGCEPDAWIISIGELEQALTNNDPRHLSETLRAWVSSGLSESSLHNFITLDKAWTVLPGDRPQYVRDNAEALRRLLVAEMSFEPGS
jgi:hypothetical protein